MNVKGTPQQVKDDVKELIDTFGDNGGLIIDSIFGFPDESKPENIQAVSEAIFEYGVNNWSVHEEFGLVLTTILKS